MNTFQVLLLLTLGTLAVNVLGFICRRAEGYLSTRQGAAPPASSAGKPPVPPETTAGFWWRKVLSMPGMIGLVISPLQAWIVWVNSDLLRLNFETLFDRGGIPILSIMLVGMPFEISDLYLYGALVTVAQMVAASTLYQQTCKQPEPSKLLAMLASTALIMLMGFEVGSSVYRGMTVDGGMWNTVLSGMLALGLASLDALVGVYLIDHFLAVFLLALAWTLAAPICALSRWTTRTDGAWVVLSALSAVDHAVMTPLRRVDRYVSGLLPDRTSRSNANREGAANVTEKTPELSGDRSRNGHEPGRLSGETPAGPRLGADHSQVLGLDVTNKRFFPILRDEMLPAVALCRLKYRDELHVIAVDSESDQPEVFASLTQSVNMHKRVVAIYEAIRTNIRRPEPYRGTTDLAGVLAYAKRLGRALAEQHAQAQARGQHLGPVPRIVVTVFTDGLPEGKQSKLPSGPWPEALTLWFFGVKAEHEGTLSNWAAEKMGLTPEMYRIVLMNDWQKMAASVYGHAIGRPHQQLDLLKRLQVARNGNRS